jgi:predicted lipoprotein
MAPTGAVVNAEPKAAVAVSLSPVTRSALAARIHGIVAQGLDAVERVLSKVGPADESGAERSARTLAAVARTLQEMAALTKPEAEVMPPDDADDDDPIPRDINEFRRELARRIRNFIEIRRNGAGRILDQRESEVD